MSDHGLFSSYDDQQATVTGQDLWGVFHGCAQGFGRLDAGSRVDSTSSKPPPPWTSVFQFSLLSAVNAIGTQLRDPINSGLTRWRMAVS